jgi:hypothetical protein
VVVTDADDEVRLALGHIGEDLERAVVVEEREGEDSVLASIVVAHT